MQRVVDKVVRAGKGELISRWEREPGRSMLRRLAAVAAEMQFPGHGKTAEEVEAIFGGRDLRGAPLRGCIVGIDFRGWDLSYAQLDIDLVDCDFTGACFDEASGHSKMLTGRLEGASFRRARITYGDFGNVVARRACFDRATLTGSSFEGADLTNASFRDAKCKKVRFGHARVVGCDFRRAILDEAVFLEARINASTDLGGASLARLNRSGPGRS